MVAFFIAMSDATYLMDLALFLCLLGHFLNYKCIIIYKKLYYIKKCSRDTPLSRYFEKGTRGTLAPTLIFPMKVVVERSTRRIIVIFYSFSVVPSPFLELYLAQYLIFLDGMTSPLERGETSDHSWQVNFDG
jgi:hypothetical protein